MDDAVELIEAEHGLVGFAVLIKLYQKIYSEGYFYKWTDKQQILFSNRASVDRNKVITIIDDCIKWEIFHEELYNKYKILSSRRIQSHYITVTYKRVNVEVIHEYMLIDVSDDGNLDTSAVTDDKSTQSKGKERKGKERKGKESTENDAIVADFKFILNFYQKNYEKPKPYIKDDLKIWIDDIGKDLVLEALKKALDKNKNYDYAKAIMNNWVNNNIKTLEDVESQNTAYSNATKRSSKTNPRTQEVPPAWMNQDTSKDDEIVEDTSTKRALNRLEELRIKS